MSEERKPEYMKYTPRLRKVRFGSGGLDWRWIGYVIAKNLTGYRAMPNAYDVDVIATGDDMAKINIELLSKGELDIAITIHWLARRGEKGLWPYKTKMPNIRAVATIPFTRSACSPVFAVKADIGIESFEQLVEKRYPLKIKGKAANVFEKVLQEYDFSFEDIVSCGGRIITGPDGVVEEYYKPENVIAAMKEGKIDAIIGSSPGPWGKIAQEIPLKFLSIPDDITETLKQKFDYTFRKVPPNTLYIGQDKEFTTSFTPGFLIATREESSVEFVKTVTKAIHENSREIADIQARLVGQPGVAMANTWGVPLHQGAEEYYKSLGWIL